MGDVGRLEGGLLYLASRKRDMIIRAGENVYPVEIENRLVEHPDVAEAAVIGAPHDELGQEVKAVVVPRDGSYVASPEIYFSRGTRGSRSMASTQEVTATQCDSR